MNSIMNTNVLLGLVVSLLACAPASAGDIKMSLESPKNSATYQGVANLRGWAISTVGIDRVELFIDGVYKADIPDGGSRKDVGSANPSYPDADQSGFSMAYNYGLLSDGNHSILVRAIDKDEAHLDKTVNIQVIGFDSGYIGNPDDFDLSGASVNAVDNRLEVTGLRVSGQAYDAELSWRAETQRYEFTEIIAR